MKTLVALTFVALVASGRVTKEPTPEVQTSTPAKEPVRLSKIEGIPVPPTAKFIPATRKPLRDDIRTEMYQATDMTFDELDAWYERRMPKGRSWNGWQWNKPIPGRTYVSRDYCRAGRDGIGVTITREKQGIPPGIIISQDGSGSGCPKD